MRSTLWRLVAAGSGAMVALAMSASTAGATSSHEASRWRAPTPSVLQLGRQQAQTNQRADSGAESKQLVPINLNAPIQLLSNGDNGGKTVQSNSSKAESRAENSARTEQVMGQDQTVHGSSAPSYPTHPTHPSYSSHPSHPTHPSSYEHGSKCDCGHGDSWKHDRDQWKPDRNRCEHGDHGKYHRPDRHDGKDGKHGHEAPRTTAVQAGAQHAATNQDARSEATSSQVLPVNVNVPVQVLSNGWNGGNTSQSNSSKAESSAENQAKTGQELGQDQRVSGHDGRTGAVQAGEQQAATDQDAQSQATSTQVAPVNVNAPVQVLSNGGNGGHTVQSNSSSAGSSAANSAGTFQGLGQGQLVNLG